MTIFYIDPSLGFGEAGYPYSNGAAYTPTIGGGGGTGVIYDNTTSVQASGGYAGNNHKFYHRRGYFHDGGWGFMTKTGLLFDAYGPSSAALPVLDGTYYMNNTSANNALWTHNGNGIWWVELAGATTVAYQVRFGGYNNGFTNGTTPDRIPGITWRRANSIADVGPATSEAGGRWFCNPGSPYRLYVWTGSTTIAPPAAYGGLTIQIGTLAKAYGLAFRNGAVNNTVRNLAATGFRQITFGCANFTSGGARQIFFNNLYAYANTAGILVLEGVGASGYVCSEVTFNNVIIDSMSYNVENKDTLTIGSNDGSTGQTDDVLKLTNSCTGITFSNIQITYGDLHSGVSLSDGGTATYWPTYISLINIKQTYINAGYGRAFGFGGGAATNVLVSKSYVTGAPVQSQINGLNITFKDCYWTANPQSYAGSKSFCPVVVNCLASAVQDNVNIKFIRNTFNLASGEAVYACVGFVYYSTSTYTLGANQVTIQDCVGISTDTSHGLVARLPFNAAAQSGHPMGNQIITNNYFIRPDGSTAILANGNVDGYFNGSSVAINQLLNGFVGSSGNFGATQNDAVTTSDGVPLQGSPLIGTGTSSFFSGESDLNFKARSYPPTIGAIEYIRPRNSRI